jgi:plasmid stability protein
MAGITIPPLDEGAMELLRKRAERHGHTVEDEVRDIVTDALNIEEPNLATAIRRIFEPLGGIELPEIPREPMRDLPTFE